MAQQQLALVAVAVVIVLAPVQTAELAVADKADKVVPVE
jgi:hypothetical protein